MTKDLCNMFLYCSNGISGMCDKEDYMLNCKYRDKILSTIVQRMQILEAHNLGLTLHEYLRRKNGGV